MTARPADPHIGLVVEGAGDKNALPLLLRAHLATAGEFRDVLGKPIPFHGKSKATAPGGIEGYCGTLDLGAAEFDPDGRGLTILESLIRPDKYVKPVWQPRLAARVDIGLVARRSASFARLLRKVVLLAERLSAES